MLEKDATWVAIGFILFILLLVYFKVPGQITKILDNRANKIRSELDEAKKLREEAQAMLADFQKKNKDAEKNAKALIDEARKLAKNYEKDAKSKFDENMERRKKLLDEKLKRAEVEALNQIKNDITDIVFDAIDKSLSNNNINSEASDKIIDNGIKEITK
ncbi:MAG: ATP F0F1 synthase subunit B [Rhodobiaceae bacterium]|nr:ATP F0F1 synthase subunit B [Rhodobiaceae bacterium]RPF97206.1 MAG: ATP F0F1 synthase subunit B [Rhizobiales bacterium TMED227]